MNDDDVLTVKLTAIEWQRVFTLMGDQPLKNCADLVFKIRDQCMAQQRQDQQEPANASC